MPGRIGNWHRDGFVPADWEHPRLSLEMRVGRAQGTAPGSRSMVSDDSQGRMYVSPLREVV